MSNDSLRHLPTPQSAGRWLLETVSQVSSKARRPNVGTHPNCPLPKAVSGRRHAGHTAITGLWSTWAGRHLAPMPHAQLRPCPGPDAALVRGDSSGPSQLRRHPRALPRAHHGERESGAGDRHVLQLTIQDSHNVQGGEIQEDPGGAGREEPQWLGRHPGSVRYDSHPPATRASCPAMMEKVWWSHPGRQWHMCPTLPERARAAPAGLLGPGSPETPWPKPKLRGKKSGNRRRSVTHPARLLWLWLAPAPSGPAGP